MDTRQRKIPGGREQSSSPLSSSSSLLEKKETHNSAKNSTNRSNQFRSFSRLINARLLTVLAVYWLSLFHIFERVRVKSAMSKCAWENWENWTGEKANVLPHRAAFIADPQLVDDHTYPKMPRALNYLIRRMSDNYHYINYHYLQEILEPHTTFFIGDLFDGGRDWEDEPWLEEYRRFNRIFPENKDPNRKSYRGLPGNHDIGFQTVIPAKTKRFATYFGEPNEVYVLGNHTFVQLDTISLSHENPEVHAVPRQFLETCKQSLDPDLPRILLTHVPLFRDPNVETCGPGRESGKPFPLMRGVEYQTVIDYPFSEDILKNLHPILVFSGDDHDYCDMTHVDYSDNSKKLAREISCKTNSMTNGIKRPAVQLLSLNNPENKVSNNTYETTMCYLPSPYLGVKVYFMSLSICLALFYVWFVCPQIVVKLSKGQLKPASVNSTVFEKRATFAAHSGTLILLVIALLTSYNPM